MLTDNPAHANDDTPVRLCRRYDWTEVSPTTAIVEMVAAVMNKDPMELDHLSNTIDPDGLDKLLRRTEGTPPGDFVASFTYHRHQIEVRDTGLVSVYPPGTTN